ncbi:MAG: acyl-CoA/acyl-ACP dehydrogenase [Chloroflexi bacterium]|nr:acyl-CoA/acyl-ACP dehydrogenase [Chloroflexota bacterium]MBV9602800.1 acyl-CoA/acyl-ACP dehydrogenase [Chloroflexota bacterium]
MTVSTTTQAATRLNDEMLSRFRERAPIYDRENRFFDEDFEELRRAGYLTIAVPQELGGAGMTLAQVIAEQRRLAYFAPATALAVNMHIYWTGVAADLRRMGDPSLEWMLTEAAAGEVFAAGHAETGNDLPVLLSTAKAEPVDGGYRISGHKMFGSLTPVWTRLGVHAMDVSDPSGPRIVHAFVQRGTPGYAVRETWDTLGMRPTRSDDTVLDGVFVPGQYIARIVPAGAIDPFVGAVFAWALLNFGSVYYAIAERARDLAITSARKKTSLGLSRPMAYHPEIQHLFSEMQLQIEAMGPQLQSVAEDWSNGVDHGAAWPMKIVAAKYNCVEGAKRVVDLAMTASGGVGMFKANELERLYRDVRCGGFHPANTTLTHEIVGKTTLGIGLDEQPRWG